MKKKLYVVKINYQAYVWAEDDCEAEDFADEIVANERPSIWTEEVKQGKNPLSWQFHCLVYHDGPEEIDIGQILAGDA
jgi:hypothetical protein